MYPHRCVSTTIRSVIQIIIALKESASSSLISYRHTPVPPTPPVTPLSRQSQTHTREHTLNQNTNSLWPSNYVRNSNRHGNKSTSNEQHNIHLLTARCFSIPVTFTASVFTNVTSIRISQSTNMHNYRQFSREKSIQCGEKQHIYTVLHKNQPGNLPAHNFGKCWPIFIFFTLGLSRDWSLRIPSHLKRVDTLPCETLVFKNW